jgi:hypothetical protein
VEEGLCVGPVYLPEWFIDVDRLNAVATHSVTMNRFSLPKVSRYYERRRVGAQARARRTARRSSVDHPVDDELPLLVPDGGDEGDGSE